MNPNQTHFKNALNVVLISGFIVVGCVALLILLLVRPTIKTNPEYGVVFDAGSSHTSVYVYEWPGNKRLRGTAVPVSEIYSGYEIPGISSFVNNTKGAGLSLKILLKNATKNVPQDKKPFTPVYLGATAGMRLLREVNETISNDIMSSVGKVLAKSGFQYSKNSTRIITGEEEGSCGWITVNYLKKILQDKQKEDIKTSSGALDLGGASTQITFVPQNSSLATKRFKLYGKDYPVYTKSYLCYGLTEIYRRFLAQLAKNANYSATISNPCGRNGTSFNQSASNIWLAPCSCQPSPKPSRTQFTFVGSSNDSECTNNVMKLFYFNSTCRDADPFFNGTRPQVTGSFLAFSGYSIFAKKLKLPSSPTMKQYKSAYQNYCNKTEHEVKELHAKIHIIPTCFAGHYIYALLTYGFGFTNNTWKISFENTVDKKSLGWAFGYMIDATNIIPLSEPKHARIKDAILIPALVVCGVCILIGVIMCSKYCWWKALCKKSGRTGYTPI
mgnify:CR=1 FL=1